MGAYQDFADKLRERGHGAIPIWHPDTKAEGVVAPGKQPAMKRWQSFGDKPMPQHEHALLMRHQHHGIGVAMGKRLAAIDIDIDELVEPIRRAMPYTPCRKVGRKGLTLIYAAPHGGLEPAGLTVQKVGTNVIERAVDVLGNGRQTVLPPSLHPATGEPYRWVGELALEDADIEDLPEIPADVVETLKAVVTANGYEFVKAVRDEKQPMDRSGASASFGGKLNDAALRDVKAWFPDLGLEGTVELGLNQWRAVPSWRDSGSAKPGEKRKPNLGVDPAGIRDFGDASAGENGRGYTPINLVMTALGLSDHRAMSWLEERLGFEPDADPNAVISMQNLQREFAEKRAQRDRLRSERGHTAGNTALKPNPQAAQKPIEFLSAREFTDGFVAPEYLIDGVIRRSFCYSFTAPTGSGKTAIALDMAISVATGEPFGGKNVEQGAVLFLAGENPDDVRARVLITAEARGFDLNELPIYFIPGHLEIGARMAEVAHQVENGPGEVKLVIVDTSAAYFTGEDENNNPAMKAWASTLRRFCHELPGRPATVIPAHPKLNATKDTMIPRGGGAFLSEVDGNIALFKDNGVVKLYDVGKIRGPRVEPISFEIITVTSDKVKDARGRLIPGALARAITDEREEELVEETLGTEDALLLSMLDQPGLSLSARAVAAGLVDDDGKPKKTTVNDAMRRMAKNGGGGPNALVQQDRAGKWELTPNGGLLARQIKTGKKAASKAAPVISEGFTVRKQGDSAPTPWSRSEPGERRSGATEEQRARDWTDRAMDDEDPGD